jgi:hypothetical protein
MQQFDRNFAMQALIPRPKDEAHTSAAQPAQDLVRPEPLANLRNHASDSPYRAFSLLSLEDIYNAGKGFYGFLTSSTRIDSQLCLERIPHSITHIG